MAISVKRGQTRTNRGLGRGPANPHEAACAALGDREVGIQHARQTIRLGARVEGIRTTRQCDALRRCEFHRVERPNATSRRCSRHTDALGLPVTTSTTVSNARIDGPRRRLRDSSSSALRAASSNVRSGGCAITCQYSSLRASKSCVNPSTSSRATDQSAIVTSRIHWDDNIGLSTGTSTTSRCLCPSRRAVRISVSR